MKLTILIMFLFVMQISASVIVHGQKLTIQTRNETLREVLREIERQSSYRFFYNDAFADFSKFINISIEDKTIDEAMNELLSSSGMSYKIMDNNLVVIAPKKELQQRTISGKVTDINDSPLPGVSIFVRGTTQGTISDGEGKYEITISPDAQI